MALEEADQYIDFMAKYKDWIAIKRIGIREHTKPEEIAFYLAGIRAVAEKKAYPILGIKTEVLDNFVAGSTKGMGKTTDSLVTIASIFRNNAAKEAVEQSTGGNKDLRQFAEAYLLNQLICAVGFETSLSQAAMAKVWKELKLPKPKGRLPGSGKKKEADAEEA